MNREWIESPMIDVTNETQKNQRLFKTMTYEERALDLDILSAANGSVITGVRLRDLGGHLKLEMRETPISFSSGKLVQDRSVWVANDNTAVSGVKRIEDKRQKLELISPDVPTKYMGQSKIDSRHNQFILFDATSAYKDVSQNLTYHFCSCQFCQIIDSVHFYRSI